MFTKRRMYVYKKTYVSLSRVDIQPSLSRGHERVRNRFIHTVKKIKTEIITIFNLNQLKSCKGNYLPCTFKEGQYCFISDASDILLYMYYYGNLCWESQNYWF